MKNLLRFLVVCLLTINCTAVFGQGLPCPPNNNSTVSAGPDVTICPNQCATLNAFGTATLQPTTTTYTVDSPAYTAYPYYLGTQVNITVDDNYSGLIPLPFSFCFYGTKYTQIVVGSNGQISFNAAVANAYCPWVINGGIPGVNGTSGASTLNCIMSPFYDMLPTTALGGSIRYNTYGTAPCRTFVVSWDSIAMFGCNAAKASHQIVLHESTYQIDINVRDKPGCSTWNSGLAILGIQNATGSAYTVAPGYNGTNFIMTNKSFRFTPAGPSGTASGSSYKWFTLSGNQVGTGTTVTVCPTVTTDYVLKAEFYSGCDTIRKNDTVKVIVANSVVSGFTYTIHYGCNGDTVIFNNLSTGAVAYNWEFGDGTGDTAKNPVHIYQTQGIFNVRMIATASNNVCKDTTKQQIDLVHPLDAKFTVDDDSVCQFSTVNFTNTSVTTTRNNIAPTYYWDFGDGGSSTQENPSHVYTKTGSFKVIQYVTDFVPCTDTFSHIVVVDSVPYINFTVSDSVLCVGQGVTFTGDYLLIGNTGIRWEFGDGTSITNRNPILHGFDAPGTYTVKFIASYRICPDTTAKKDLIFKPYPHLDLGKDTTICPYGDPVTIGDQNPGAYPGGTYLWNTGETTPSITVNNVGRYTASITVDGCSAADSVDIFKDCYIDIPNAFTPNGDGSNDFFFPRQFLSRSVTSFKFQVFNRWGQLIFETNRTDGRGWDGRFNDKEQPSGVYVYVIDVVFKNGTKEHYQGNVTLLR